MTARGDDEAAATEPLPSWRRRTERADLPLMDPFILFLKAAGIGVAIAAPVGPMALLCMRRSLALGWRQGLATGFGIATGDCAYALVAAAGLSGLSDFLLLHARPLHFAAALALFYFGLTAFRSRVSDRGPGIGRGSYLSSVLLTLTNPPTIIAFAAFFTALAPPSGLGPAGVALTAGGVFAGSLLWWLGLIAAITGFRTVIGNRWLRMIDYAAGIFFLVFGGIELRRALVR